MTARRSLGAAAKPTLVALIVIACGFLPAAQSRGPSQRPSGPQIPTHVRERAERSGSARVIVQLRLDSGAFVPERALPPQAAEAQRRGIERAAGRVVGRLNAGNHRVARRFRTSPYLALEVSAAGLASLESSPDVARVMDDALLTPVLADSTGIIQADQAWGAGFDGTGTVIAVLDTGVDASHPFFTGRIIEEACFSTTQAGLSQSYCPNGQDEQTGPGAAAPCGLGDCFHWTHVAGIAAGSGASAGQPFSGVAPGARIIPVQVFSQINDAASCSTGVAPCAAAFTSDVLAGLEYVISRLANYNVVAVNMSLGGGLFETACDDQPFKPLIDNLRAANVASVVASGNSGSRWSMSTPACVSTAVSVGSVTKSNQVSWFTNVAPGLLLHAPGDSITSSVPGGGFNVASGTSMAAPHVAGTWAILRQAKPDATVGALLSALTTTGVPVPDSRFLGVTTVPRIRVFDALSTVTPIDNPAPVLNAVSPSPARAGMGPVAFTLTGSGFTASSVVLWNGTPQPSTTFSSSEIRFTAAVALVASAGQAHVAVSNPPPGGGTSATLTITLDPPPTLTVNSNTASGGASVTMTLAHGLGAAQDWLALAVVGSPNNQYVKWTNVGGGVTNRTWTVTMPSTAGSYEFRLFNGAMTRLATSPPVVVTAPPNPVPTVSSLSPAQVTVGGPAFTLTVNGTGFVSSSVVKWNGSDRPTTFVSSSQLRAAISDADIASNGVASVKVFSPAPGGGTSNSRDITIGAAPNITVNTGSASAGANVTATLHDGTGGAGDWLALAEISSPNTTYVRYVYVGAGVTTRTWTVAMPTTPGTYEFRLFLNNGYTRAATSPAVTVTQGTNPAPMMGTISPSAAIAGSGAFTLTVTGSNFTPSSVIRWNGSDRPTTYVSASQLRASIAASDVAATGTAQVTVFTPAPGGGLSTAQPFTIGTAPVLTVSAASVAPGANVTVTLTNGTGGAGDWIALAPTAAANTSYVRYTYVGQGNTTKTWTVAVPTTPGTYEFRLFLANGYTRAATSPTVTVTVQ
jgi:subtilisin family serine protease